MIIKSTIKPAVISLFSGAGGLDLGFAEAGFDTVLAIDSNKQAVETFRHNWAKLASESKSTSRVVKVVEADLASFSAEDVLENIPNNLQVAGVIGGPPCQAFSRGNVRPSPLDPRRKLALKYAELVSNISNQIGLDFVVFENVPGLRDKRNLHIYKKVCNTLTRAGFDLSEGKLNAWDFGVAQRRIRTFVIGINRERFSHKNFNFPISDESPKPLLRDVLPVANGAEPIFFRRGLTPDRIRDDAGHPNHWTMMPRSAKFIGPRGFPKSSKSRSFRLLDWGLPSPTVAYGHREIHVHPSGKRRLSIFEAMKLQGFPDWYELHGNMTAQSMLVSDAVPPPLAKAIGANLLEIIR